MISRANLSETASKSLLPNIQAAEKLIDEQLLKHVEKNGMHGYITVPPASNAYLTREVVSRYQQNGYKAEYISDQRDGDYIQIWLD